MKHLTEKDLDEWAVALSPWLRSLPARALAVVVAEGPMLVTDLATRLGTNPSRAHEAVDALAQACLVKVVEVERQGVGRKPHRVEPDNFGVRALRGNLRARALLMEGTAAKLGGA